MAACTSNEIYHVAVWRFNAPHEEAMVAAQNSSAIEELMSRNSMPVEWAIFSFLTERRIRQDEMAAANQQMAGWRKWIHKKN